MSGVLRLTNDGGGSGRSTIVADANNDQTFRLPEAGGTLLTTNYSVAGGTITFDGSDIIITNGDLNVDNGTLFVDESTNKVGIGTTTPSIYAPASNNLVIFDSADAGITIRSGTNNDGSIYFNDTDDGNQRGIVRYNHQTDALAFHTPIGEVGRFTNEGTLCIGKITTSSASHLVQIHNNTGAGSSYLQSTNTGTGTSMTDGCVLGMGDANNAFFWNYEDGNIRFATNGTRRAALTRDGNAAILNIGAGNEAAFSGGNRITLFVGATDEDYAYIGSQYNASNLANQGQVRFVVENNASGVGALAFATGGSTPQERARIDSAGRLLLGTNSSRFVLSSGSPGLLQVEVQGGNNYPMTLMANRADQFGPILAMCKSRGTTAGSQTAIQAGDSCGQIFFGGTDGSDEVGSGAFESVAAAAPVAGVGVPADLTLSTGDSTGTLVERIRIESSGRLRHNGGITSNGGGANFNPGSYYRMTAARTIPAGATVDITINGLTNGWLTVKGGGFANAGQCSFGCFYFIGGYFTQTSEYDVTTIQQFTKGATISVIENPANVVIRVVNNGSNPCNSNWCFESNAPGIRVAS